MNGDFYLDAWLVQPSLCRLSLDGQVVQVRPKVMDLLVYLAASSGTVISKDTLLNDVWGTEAITESALTRTITELRSALGDDAERPRYLETIPKRGYRLIAAVRPISSPAEPGSPRRRVAAVAVGIVGILLSGSVAFLLFDARPAAPTDAPQVKPLTTLPGQEGQPSFSPDGTQVAFVWGGEDGANFDIYIKRLVDQSLVRLTTDPAPDRSPAWAPDGRSIAFVRGSTGAAGVYVVPPTGGGERPVATLRRASAPARLRILDWADDGRALVVVDQNSPEEPFYIVRLSVETGERFQLTSPPPRSYGDTHPALSRDGRTLAFTRSIAPPQFDIYLMPLRGGEPRRVTFDGSVIGGLAWSEDGGSIVFSSERGANAGTGSLWRIAIDGSTARREPEQLRGIGPRALAPNIARRGGRLAYQEYFQDTNVWRVATDGGVPPQQIISSTREENFPDYSSDGTRIAFASNRSGNWETWIANADGSRPQQVTTYAATPAWSPRWSPDGRLLAFQHTAEGNADVYTITPEGSNVRRLTTAASTEQNPFWSRNGRWLYFSSDRSGAFEIWRMAVNDPEQVVQITRGGGMYPQEGPAGDRIFYLRSTDSGLEIWGTPVNGTGETRMVGPIRSPAAWVPGREGIYFIERAGRISYYRFETRTTTSIATLANEPSTFNPGLTLSPDGRWLLYGQMDRSGADIMLVENFR